MTTITKERIELFIKNPLENGLTRGEQMELARIALASLEAEPVAYIFKHPAGKLFWALTDESNKDQSDVIPVYAAPPVPVVPAALPENDDEDGHDIDYLEPSEVYSLGRTAGWNACRAAMLHGAEPVSQTYKLPPLSSNEVNDAAWKLRNMLTEHGPLNGRQFNNLKGCFYEALKVAMRNYPVTTDGWISCSDRMPNEEDVLVYCSDTKEQMVGFHKGKGLFQFFYMNGVEGVCEPSHWMRLPEPPQEVNRGKPATCRQR